jgi:DNA-binding CsgD family transcriptional regulator
MNAYSSSASSPKSAPPRGDRNGQGSAPLWQFFRSIFHNAPEAIAMLDASLRVVVWNAAASALTGHHATDILGRGCRVDGNLITLDLAAEPGGDGVRAPRTRPSSSGQFSVRTADRAWGPLPATVIPLQYDGSVLLMLPRPAEDAGRAAVRRRASKRAGAGPRSSSAVRRLTEREHEILKLLAAGKTAKAIAAELALSLPTVRSHTQHILRKLGVHSSLEAVVWFLRTPDGGGSA